MDLVDYVFEDKGNYRPSVRVDQLEKPDPDDWELSVVDGDGNCFYHCLCMSTQRNLTPLRIRHELLKYIDKSNYSLPNITEVIARIYRGIEADMRGEVVKADSWANHEEIQLCARMYNIVIAVWSAEYEMWSGCFPVDDVFLLSNCRKAVYLHNDGCHFNLLRRKGKLLQ